MSNNIAPYIDSLKKSRLGERQTTLVTTLESNLDKLVSPFIARLSSKFSNFTPMEIRVASLIKDGRTNKEIANLLTLSINTILTHRQNVRRKLGLTNKSMNLRSYLLSLEK